MDIYMSMCDPQDKDALRGMHHIRSEHSAIRMAMPAKCGVITVDE